MLLIYLGIRSKPSQILLKDSKTMQKFIRDFKEKNSLDFSVVSVTNMDGHISL